MGNDILSRKNLGVRIRSHWLYHILVGVTAVCGALIIVVHFVPMSLVLIGIAVEEGQLLMGISCAIVLAAAAFISYAVMNMAVNITSPIGGPFWLLRFLYDENNRLEK